MPAESILGASGEEGRAESGTLFRRLVYLTAFRLAIVTALLGATLWVTRRPGDQLEGTTAFLLYGLIAFIYGVSLAFLWMLRSRRRLTLVASAQVAGDVCVATFLVYLTGGADSLFTLMYPLAIVNASILLRRRGTIVTATASALSFALLVLLLDRSTLQPAADYLAQRSLSTARLGLVVFANGAAFFLTAALASYLTEQLRRTGERLSEREIDFEALSELHRSIVQSLSSAVLTTDERGVVVFANPAAARMTGRPVSALVHRKLSETLPAVAEAVASGAERGEVSFSGSDGALRQFSYVVSSLERQSDRPPTAGGAPEPTQLFVIEDRTALRSMQEAVRRSDRLAAVGELAAGLAHELRNPLASMGGAVELLSRGSQLSEADRRLFGIVQREAERLNLLVTDFLAFARPPPVKPESIDVVALAEETLNVFRHAPAAHSLELLRTGAGRVRVHADPGQLRQVLWNLLLNAADALEGQGRISVDVDLVGSGLCRIAVVDNGPGISPEGLARLFEPFYTTKSAGTGLGLASVHRIVEAHDGTVEVTSEEGKGASFVILLPVVSPDESRAA